MNYALPLILCSILSLHCAEQKRILVRQAHKGWIPDLNALSTKQYQNDFKPLWEKYYAPLFPGKDVDQFIAEKTKLNNEKNEAIIKNEDPNNPLKLMVAYTLEDRKSDNKLVGFCRLEKQDEQSVYIHFILVDENFRKQGIGRQLIKSATEEFPGTTKCRFRALIHNVLVNEMYLKHGCQQIGTIALDSDSGKPSTDPNAPITHFDYEYIIQK
jgi:ribosomal protein S18 acetylase RimI-like enzyme